MKFRKGQRVLFHYSIGDIAYWRLARVREGNRRIKDNSYLLISLLDGEGNEIRGEQYGIRVADDGSYTGEAVRPLPKLTPHQLDVYLRLCRHAARTYDGWVAFRSIGSQGALDKLMDAGLIERDYPTTYYRPTRLPKAA